MRKFSVLTRFFTFLLLCVSLFAFGSHPAFAGAGGGGLNPCDTSQGNLDLGNCLILKSSLGTVTTVKQVYALPADLINLIVRNIYILGGIILFFMIIYAGFLFIAQGEKGIEKAKTVITTALMGFIIMFAAYWILRIIKIITGADIVF